MLLIDDIIARLQNFHKNFPAELWEISPSMKAVFVWFQASEAQNLQEIKQIYLGLLITNPNEAVRYITDLSAEANANENTIRGLIADFKTKNGQIAAEVSRKKNEIADLGEQFAADVSEIAALGRKYLDDADSLLRNWEAKSPSELNEALEASKEAYTNAVTAIVTSSASRNVA